MLIVINFFMKLSFPSKRNNFRSNFKANIHTGDRFGSYLDFIINTGRQIHFKVKNNLLFEKHSEMFRNIYGPYPEFLPSQNKLVVDVGCQLADYAILSDNKYHAKVVAFEVLSENYRKAQKFIKRNRANVQLYNFGISDSEYQKTVSYNENILHSDLEGTKVSTVQFKTLDSFSFVPDLLKIDVEGFEMNVLRGAIETIRKYKPRIIIETHSSQLEEQVKHFLKENNYKDPKEYNRFKARIPWMDSVVNLFFMPEDRQMIDSSYNTQHANTSNHALHDFNVQPTENTLL